MFSNNRQVFLALVRAGLWERDVHLSPYGEFVLGAVYRLAEEQAVMGLVSAGLEHVVDVTTLPKEAVLTFVGAVLPLEHRNLAMNRFVGEMAEKMREAGISPVLVKGQGVAQCYERPLWRASGDVDFLLGQDGYDKAKAFLLPMSSSWEREGRYSRHFGLTIDSWYVELHGSLRTGLSGRVDKVVDEVQRDVFQGGAVRSWLNDKTTISLPAPNNDVFLVFTHFIKHFYKERVIFRQICDWCRLLWTYREAVDPDWLKERIRRAGLMREWQSFAALAVDYLGMPVEAMPLYSDEKKWHAKGEKIMAFALSGARKSKVKAMLAIGKIFPWNTFLFSPAIFFHLNWMKVKERVLNG